MNNFMNIKKVIEIGNPFWDRCYESGLIDIVATYSGHGKFVTREGHKFINMCSYSYLGLDSHPKIIQGAVDGVLASKMFNYSITRTRIVLDVLKETEDLLTTVFGADAITLSRVLDREK